MSPFQIVITVASIYLTAGGFSAYATLQSDAAISYLETNAESLCKIGLPLGTARALLFLSMVCSWPVGLAMRMMVNPTTKGPSVTPTCDPPRVNEPQERIDYDGTTPLHVLVADFLCSMTEVQRAALSDRQMRVLISIATIAEKQAAMAVEPRRVAK